MRSTASAGAGTSLAAVDELVVVRRSSRRKRWALSVPWGGPVTLGVPARMAGSEIERVLASHRTWIARERGKQVPRLGLDASAVSEPEARRAALELVRIDPREPRSWVLLAESYRELKRFSTARRLADKAERIRDYALREHQAGSGL